MAIAYDAAKIKAVAFDYDGSSSLIKNEIGKVEENLDVISNPANWSGPIANTAKSDMTNAATALKNIKSNMDTISAILNEASTNFGNIKYGG